MNWKNQSPHVIDMDFFGGKKVGGGTKNLEFLTVFMHYIILTMELGKL